MENTVSSLLKDRWSIQASGIHKLYGEKDLNFHITAPGGEYVLKLHHGSTPLSELEAQDRMLQFLSDKVEVILPLPVPERSAKAGYIQIEDTPYLPRLLTWVGGQLWSAVPSAEPERLISLGQQLGSISRALKDYQDGSLSREQSWAPDQAEWAFEHLDELPEARRELVKKAADLYRKEFPGLRPGLRESAVYMDANDNNIILSANGLEVTGFIDFGDANFSLRVNEIAVALAYALMGLPEPLRAAETVVRAYHVQDPLGAEECDAIHILVAMRLLISVTYSALRKANDADNEYWFISERPAWDLLEKWMEIPYPKARNTFRLSCGHPSATPITDLRDSITAAQPFFVLGEEAWNAGYELIDLSTGSLEMGNPADFLDPDKFQKRIRSQLKDKGLGFLAGGYLEYRTVYRAERFHNPGNEGRTYRSLHLGQDLWSEAGTAVYAPMRGTVHSIADNEGEGNYGPTIILHHELDDLTFYTLYGHLSKKSLDGLVTGQPIERGEKIAELGAFEENGNWVPHLHFQAMYDTWGMEGDFPGVASAWEKPAFADNCLPPAWFTGIDEENREDLPEELLKKREALLGPNLSLSYREPLFILRGYRHHLFEANGRPYLDLVNNVAHVGHEHPKVAEAVSRQSAVLNTNTRYLHPLILDYAEELLSTFPSQLSVCYFVNSGSEANELALRIARTVTGRKAFIAMEMGYHGNTAACVDVSSYKFDRKGGKGRPSDTYLLSSPDPFRYPERAATISREISDLLGSMENEGKAPAGLIAEPILSCAGQVVPPEGYYQEVFRKVQEAGGLCIADEVQVGFGRVGTHMWAFNSQGISPDIVTLGKPMGNGHPVGAVITTPEIAKAFSNGMEFFSTFGGNPVSCAAGRAVLNVLKEESLMENANDRGEQMLAGLRELQGKFPLIADVRGNGLFLGFELWTEEGAATEQAGRLVNIMRRRGILLSTDGPDENVVKIKPPLCITGEDVDHLLTELEEAFSLPSLVYSPRKG